MNKYDVLLKPILTEKSNTLRQFHQVYTFFVHNQATKQDIRKAVESMWEVKVVKVNTSILRGKVKRNRHGITKRPNRKKAMVTLEQGHVIDLFEV